MDVSSCPLRLLKQRPDERPATRRLHRLRGTTSGFTLLELILALALSVLATAIIANLVQLYSNNFVTRGEDIRRIALARSLLNMIAEDLRSTVVKQDFDASVLQQMLTGQGGGGSGGGGSSSGGSGSNPSGSASGGSGSNANGNRAGGIGQGSSASGASAGGGGAASGSSGGGGQGAVGASGGSGGAASGGSTTGGANGATGSGSDASGALSTAALPLGVYGSLSSLTIDVSRLPRPDEYIAQQTSLMSGHLTDVPGDIKSVTYFVQVPTNSGVSDTMNEVTSTPENSGMVGGLVRRQIDRAVMTNAEAMGQTDQLMRTGELIAPEVISLEFAYFDGMQWLTTWDSSTQGLPWLVEITLAMQSKSGEKKGIVSPGVSISTMPYEEQSALGIEVYTLTVAIPGAQLQATGTQSTDTAEGMKAMGL
jgi:type II secretory pathway pseudopilin PulG